jgi:hypothetical protein
METEMLKKAKQHENLESAHQHSKVHKRWKEMKKENYIDFYHHFVTEEGEMSMGYKEIELHTDGLLT